MCFTDHKEGQRCQTGTCHVCRGPHNLLPWEYVNGYEEVLGEDKERQVKKSRKDRGLRELRLPLPLPHLIPHPMRALKIQTHPQHPRKQRWKQKQGKRWKKEW